VALHSCDEGLFQAQALPRVRGLLFAEREDTVHEREDTVHEREDTVHEREDTVHETNSTKKRNDVDDTITKDAFPSAVTINAMVSEPGSYTASASYLSAPYNKRNITPPLLSSSIATCSNISGGHWLRSPISTPNSNNIRPTKRTQPTRCKPLYQTISPNDMPTIARQPHRPVIMSLYHLIEFPPAVTALHRVFRDISDVHPVQRVDEIRGFGARQVAPVTA
jgi:hypothetical protein